MENTEETSCTMEKLQKIIGGKWKIIILWNLHFGTLRFKELHKKIDGITESTLTKQLRELETDGFVKRYVYQQVPPKVEYSLSELGVKFIPILNDISIWSSDNL